MVRIMKWLLLMSLVLTLATMFLISACSQPAPSPAPAPAPAPAPTAKPTTTAPAKTWNLKMVTSQANEAATLVKFGLMPFIQAVEKRTNGQVKMSIFYLDSLAPINDHYTSVVTGIADIGHTTIALTQNRFPLAGGSELPGLFTSGKQATETLQKLGKSGLLDKETAETKVLGFSTSSPSELIFVKKKVQTVADYKGLRIRVPGGVTTKVHEIWGAVPVVMPSSEIYSSMEKSVIDGCQLTMSSVQRTKLYEVSKYIMKIGFNVSAHIFFMNSKVWSSFTPEIQNIIQEEANTCLMNIAVKAYDEDDASAEAFMKGKGIDIYTAPNRAEWMAPLTGVYDSWIKDLAAKGLPAKQVFDILSENMKK